ncbi:MAG: exo-alpha-sialidase [Saprospiraceae bacterium]|nr:exo-alpha-sialidase [Saprospiraceae bacterium]
MKIQILILVLLHSLITRQDIQAQDSVFNFNFISNNNMAEKNLDLGSNSVYQSTDYGLTWHDIGTSLPGNLKNKAFFVNNGTFSLLSENQLYHFKDGMAPCVWEKEYTLGVNIKDIYTCKSKLFGKSTEGDFFQKINGSNLWLPIKMPNSLVRTILETKSGTLIVGCDNGIFKSTDKGTTWKHVFEDGIALNMVESNGIIIAGGQQGILRSTNGGEQWDWVLREGGVGISTEVIDGGFAAITYNTTSKTRRVRISTDGGLSWQAIDGGGLTPTPSIASIKQIGKTFICGHPDGILISSDKGKTWKLVLPTIKNKVFNLSVVGKIIYAIPLNGGC